MTKITFVQKPIDFFIGIWYNIINNRKEKNILSICSRCDNSCLELNENKYCLKCQKNLVPDETGNSCNGYFETDKEDVPIDIDIETWNRLTEMAKEANMTAEDFASKLIVQRLRKVLGI